MIRYIKEDTMFTLSTGERFMMRKGDRVAMYPPAIHKDPEIFENPLASTGFTVSINIYNMQACINTDSAQSWL